MIQAGVTTRYVGVGRRAVAVIVDQLIMVVFQIPAIVSGVRWFHAHWRQFQTGAPTGTFQPQPGFARLVWVGTLAAYAYFVLMEWRFGATLGKLALGIRVVRIDGSRMGAWESFLRNTCRVVDGLFFYLVGAIIIWNSDLHQRLGDKTAKTVVVRASDLRAGRIVAPIPPPPAPPLWIPPPPAPPR